MKKIILYTIIGIIVLGAIGGAAYLATPTPKTNYITTPVAKMNIVETVTGTGEVQPDQEATLAFDQQAGTIAAVNVSVGDHVQKGAILATLESDILQASLQSAQANVTAAQAQLASLEAGAKPADIAVYTQKKADAETALSSSVHDSYLKTEDAIENQVDVLFNNPLSVNPTINIWTPNQTTQTNINSEYVTVIEALATWKADLDADTANQMAAAGATSVSVSAKTKNDANSALTAAKSFLADLGTIAAQLSAYNGGQDQTTINSERTVVNNAASEVAGAISEYTAAISAYNDATASLTLEQSSSTPDILEAQQAQVAAAQAQVGNIQAQIDHTVITAPFSGTITDVEPKVGEVFAAGVPVFTIISDGVYKVEVYVSETDVAKLAVGDSASITLSAYGSATPFPAAVTQIDPAETVTNGVNSYKVTLHFTQIDPRILSGMTANVTIVATEVSQALAIPSSALITEGSATYALVENTDGTYTQKQIQTGITGSNASSTTDTGTYVVVQSGLSANDNVASFGTAGGQ